MSYRVSRDAERDLDEIFFYVAERAGLSNADRLIEAITDRFWIIDAHPQSGRPTDNIAVGVKCFPAGKYLIYYRTIRRGIDILHIFHGARDQKKAFTQRRKR